MKKIDFRKVDVEDIDGTIREADYSKDVANYIYKETGDIGMMELAKRIYFDGEVELSHEQAAEILSMFVSSQGVRAIIKVSLKNLLTWQ